METNVVGEQHATNQLLYIQGAYAPRLDNTVNTLSPVRRGSVFFFDVRMTGLPSSQYLALHVAIAEQCKTEWDAMFLCKAVMGDNPSQCRGEGRDLLDCTHKMCVHTERSDSLFRVSVAAKNCPKEISNASKGLERRNMDLSACDKEIRLVNECVRQVFEKQ